MKTEQDLDFLVAEMASQLRQQEPGKLAPPVKPIAAVLKQVQKNPSVLGSKTSHLSPLEFNFAVSP